MKKVTKAIAAVMLMTAVFFTAEGLNAQTYNGHDYVDLGLPSGTLWATCNVGAEKPEQQGDYFAWGETKPKTIYDYDNYKYSKGDDNEHLIKYCNRSSFGYNGFTDNLTVLQSGDDAATTNWGDGWCTPTKEQWEELYENTDHTWKTRDGVSGRLFTGKNGAVLFLRAAGYPEYDMLENLDMHVNRDWKGYYWSSSLITDYPGYAWYFFFDSDHYIMDGTARVIGYSVRPVRSVRQN